MGKLSKDKRDIYYRLAKQNNYRSRAAYKLIQVDYHFNLLENLAKKGVNAVDYLNSRICYCLFLRDCERKKLAENQQKQFLIDIIKNS